MNVPLRFHWNPWRTESVEEVAGYSGWCRVAEDHGIDSISLSLCLARRDSMLLLRDSNKTTRKLKFMLTCNADLLPEFLAADMSKAFLPLENRINLQIIFDKPPVDLARMGELLRACRETSQSNWPIFITGNSAETAVLAIKYADCLWRVPWKPNQVYADALPVLHLGKEVGLCVSPIARPTRQEAVQAALAVYPEGHFVLDGVDSSPVGRCLWQGTTRDDCAAPMCLVGEFEEVADAIIAYQQKGISQFLFDRLPAQQEIMYFAGGVLPLVQKGAA